MKKIIFLLTLILFSCLTALSAHPASEVKAEFDKEKNILTVEITHSVKDSESHFIDELEIELNDEEIITQKFTFQLNDEVQKALYFIPGAKKGDSIQIKAECNKFGSKKTILKID